MVRGPLCAPKILPGPGITFARAATSRGGSLAACNAVAAFAAHDPLRAALLRERAALGEAVMQLTRAAWDEAEDPGWAWATGAHVSSQAPALAAVLLGDVEGEGAGGGVALSPAAVTAVLGGLDAAMSRPSSSGSFIWSARCPGPCFSSSRAWAR